MRQLFVLGILCLAGCQNIVGPFQHRTPVRIDDPSLSINEQKRQSRAYLPQPFDKDTQAPYTYSDRPGTDYK